MGTNRTKNYHPDITRYHPGAHLAARGGRHTHTSGRVTCSTPRFLRNLATAASTSTGRGHAIGPSR
eukprot:scaffold118051_cov54-Phaeocystis_antarctica.AAC.1